MPAICTLFEGHYHYGVAALVNSLIYQGYTGPVYMGYKGPLPHWASKAEDNPALNWPGGKSLVVADGLQLHFLPIVTDYHLTNYKPDFMLRLLEGPAKKTESMFYFDPDILITISWMFFENWIKCGVALCEDFNSPLSCYHPRRVAWRNYYAGYDIPLIFKNNIYANGGFIGLSASNFGFLNEWVKMQETMAPEIGGLGQSIFNADKPEKGKQEAYSPFNRTDQDALNAAVEAWDGAYSFIGKEGMGFAQGTSILPHAIGAPKPWKSNIIINALAGHRLKLAEINYWRYANSHIVTHSKLQIRVKRLSIIIASFIGRFYGRPAL